MPRSQYLIDIPSFQREFPPTIPVQRLLDEFAEWLRERDIYLGALRLYSERLDDAGNSGLGDLYQCFAPFIRTSCGSVVALWLPNGKPLASPPIVRIGSEGDDALLGDSLEEFLWLLAERKTGDGDLDSRDEHTGDGGPALSQWLESQNIKPARRRRWPDFAAWCRKRQKAHEKWRDLDSLRLAIAENLRAIRPFADNAEPWETAHFDAVIVGSRFQMWQRVQGPQRLEAKQAAALEPLLRADRERRANEVPERGLWFQASLIVCATGGANMYCDFMHEPRAGDERIPIPESDYREDLAKFPRSEYWMPDWLIDKPKESRKSRSATTDLSNGPAKTELGYDQTGPGRRPPWCVWGQDARAVAAAPFWKDDKNVLIWGVRDAKAPDGFSMKVWRIKSAEQQAGSEEFLNAADFHSWRDLTALEQRPRLPGQWVVRAAIGADYFFLGTNDAEILTSVGELPYDYFLNQPEEAVVMTHEEAISATVTLVSHKEIDGETEFVEPVLLADAVREEQEIAEFRKTYQPAVDAEIARRGELHDGRMRITVVPADPRLAPLEPWLQGFHRRAWLFKTEAGDGSATDCKFSGRPYLPDGKWPTCGLCGEPMQLFVQLNLSQLPDELAPVGDGLLQLFFCANEEKGCYANVYGEPFNTAQCVRMVPCPAKATRKPKNPLKEPFPPLKIVNIKRVDDYPAFRELEQLGISKRTGPDGGDVIACPKLHFEAAVPFDIYYDCLDRCVPRTKLAGWPAWVQNIEYPNCPKCQRLMDRMVVQIVPDEFLPFMLADGGRGQVLQCPDHPDVLAFTWASG